MEKMKILLVKLSSIGDIVHTLPAFAAVRDAFPTDEISWVVESGSAEILRGNHLIDHLIEIDTRSKRSIRTIDETIRALGQQVRELRKTKFDVAIDFQGLIKSAAIAKLSGAKRRYGFARGDLREPAGRFVMTHTVEVPPKTHIIRKNLLLAEKALGFTAPEDELKFPIMTGASDRFEAEAVIQRAGGAFALLNPAGGWTTKLWPAERFGALADLIYEKTGLASVITTGPKESALGEAVLKSSRSSRIISTAPGLKAFYELARRASVYVGGDTGPTHIAIAAGAPVVGIFGPTEWWRNGSPRSADIVVERNDIGCRVDCHRRTCSNWICLDIEPETVLNAVLARLNSAVPAGV